MHSARRFLCQSGGVRLAPQARSERHLNGREREEISRGIAAGESARQLAKRLGRSPSTVSREIARNGGRDRYRAATADAAVHGRGRRPKQAKLAQRPALRALVEAKLALCWSPEQIAGWLRRQWCRRAPSVRLRWAGRLWGGPSRRLRSRSVVRRPTVDR
ncbi:transposase [Streptomyces sp. NPDC006978]|uniref:helix-turn-helix domain-containing protein n=1 Tax=unclassified Streptomyces TaxID=2593676 RepID=UPI002AFE7E3A|nr:helix-turn-helix domain-containing protein [Streptomyces sp. S584]